jgi:hypothetical protein
MRRSGYCAGKSVRHARGSQSEAFEQRGLDGLSLNLKPGSAVSTLVLASRRMAASASQKVLSPAASMDFFSFHNIV